MNLHSLSPTNSPTTSSSRDTLSTSLTSLPSSVQQDTYTVALDHLASLASSTEKTLPELQTVELREPIKYSYGYKGANKKVEPFYHLFPITKKQNKLQIDGSLTATFSTRPTRTQIAEIFKQNFNVYERESGQKKEVLKKIEEVFYYSTYRAFNVDINNCFSDDKGYHFNFTLSLIFGSGSAKKAQKVFWTLKLQDLVLAQDVLVEHDADMRDKKMDAKRNPKTNGPYFEEWEQDVCWYDDYLKKFEEPEPDETDLSQTSSTSNSIDASSSTTSSRSSRKRPRLIEEDDKSDEELNNESDDDSWTPPSSSFSPSTKRSRRSENHTAVPAEEPVLVPSVSEAIDKAQMIQELISPILKSFEEQDKQRKQLQKEIQTFKSKFEQSQKQVEDLQQEKETLQAEKQVLALEVAAAQGLLAVCTPLSRQEELQAQLDKVTTQHREQATELEEAKRKLQEFEKIKSAFDKLKNDYDHLNKKYKDLEEDNTGLNRRLTRKQQDLNDAVQRRREAEINLRNFENWWKQGPNGSTSSTDHSRSHH